jgi:hypothetical protein
MHLQFLVLAWRKETFIAIGGPSKCIIKANIMQFPKVVASIGRSIATAQESLSGIGITCWKFPSLLIFPACMSIQPEVDIFLPPFTYFGSPLMKRLLQSCLQQRTFI